MRQQMVLGDFIFGLSQGFAYSTLTRSTDGGWSDMAIVASKPLSRQSGQTLEKLTFGGTAMYAVGMARLDDLRALQNARAPLPLVDGVGRNWGLWRINSVVENQSNVIDDGTAMVMTWTLVLEEFINA
ncbi:MAG: phage tail protein [Pseudomonas sp.]|uniref:phage tail protein n=1 Tax=Pseudomonas sp. TaxID=306 RepID=UPI003C73CA03